MIFHAKRYSQPQHPVEVDWGNPTNRHVKTAVGFFGQDFYDAARGALADRRNQVGGVLLQQSTPFGIGIKEPVETGGYNLTPGADDNYYPINPFAIFHVNGGVTNANQLLIVGASNGAVAGMGTTQWSISWKNTSGERSIVFTLGWNSQVLTVGGVQDGLHAVSASFSQGRLARLYLDGSMVAEGASALSSYYYRAGVNSAPFSNPTLTSVNAGAVLLRGVSINRRANAAQDDVFSREFSANPWQLFRPITRQIWVPMQALVTGDTSSALPATTSSNASQLLAFSIATSAVFSTSTSSTTSTLAAYQAASAVTAAAGTTATSIAAATAVASSNAATVSSNSAVTSLASTAIAVSTAVQSNTLSSVASVVASTTSTATASTNTTSTASAVLSSSLAASAVQLANTSSSAQTVTAAALAVTSPVVAAGTSTTQARQSLVLAQTSTQAAVGTSTVGVLGGTQGDSLFGVAASNSAASTVQGTALVTAAIQSTSTSSVSSIVVASSATLAAAAPVASSSTATTVTASATSSSNFDAAAGTSTQSSVPASTSAVTLPSTVSTGSNVNTLVGTGLTGGAASFVPAFGTSTSATQPATSIVAVQLLTGEGAATAAALATAVIAAASTSSASAVATSSTVTSTVLASSTGTAVSTGSSTSTLSSGGAASSDIYIDWGTRTIHVPRNYMTVLQTVPSEIRQLDLNAFRLALKDLEDSDAGMAYPSTHNHNTVVSISGVTLARVVELVNGYTVTFEDGQYAVNLIGANSNVSDFANVNQVSIRSSNSAGLVQGSGGGVSATDLALAVWNQLLTGARVPGSSGAMLQDTANRVAGAL